MEVLAFDTQNAGDLAAKTAWINYVKSEFAKGTPVRTPLSEPPALIETLEGLTDDQIAELLICGYRDGVLQMETGLTSSYVKLIKAYEHENWYFHTIPAEYMTGIVDYTEMELPEDWKPPGP